MLKRFLKDQSGATVIEYGLIVAVLSLAIIGSLGLVMNQIENNFDRSSGIINNSTD